MPDLAWTLPQRALWAPACHSQLPILKPGLALPNLLYLSALKFNVYFKFLGSRCSECKNVCRKTQKRKAALILSRYTPVQLKPLLQYLWCINASQYMVSVWSTLSCSYYPSCPNYPPCHPRIIELRYFMKVYYFKRCKHVFKCIKYQ